jgi:GAF domain-containing protein
VPDTLQHDRLKSHPLTTGEVGMRSTAGAPIIDPDGATIGMLIVIDTQPRDFTADDLATLDDLSAIIVSELVLRLESQAQSASSAGT